MAATLYTGDDSFGSLMIYFFSCLRIQSKSEKDEISFNVLFHFYWDQIIFLSLQIMLRKY